MVTLFVEHSYPLKVLFKTKSLDIVDCHILRVFSSVMATLVTI